jgi:4-hydroxy-2-oxoheptanedioate aldolase
LGVVDDIARVPGIDAFYVGPADMSRSLGIPPTLEQMDESFLDACTQIIEAARANGIAPGLHSTPAMSAERLKFGFQMVTVTSDVQASQLFVAASVEAVKQGRTTGGSVTGY